MDATGTAASRRPAFLPSDLEKIALNSVLALLAWTIPPRHWRRLCLALASPRPAPFNRRRRREAAAVPRAIARLLEMTPEAAAAYHLSTQYEHALQVFRLHRPGGWRPDTRVPGLEHLEAARKHGRGAILWHTFLHSMIIDKMALHAAGVPLNHLSRPGHGFSISRFGYRYLNPIQLSAEDRYLRRRVVITAQSEVQAMRTFVRLLAQNEVVSIEFGGSAHRYVELPFFDGTLSVPTGPLNLSRLTGAPLLPVFCLQRTSTEYDVQIERPVALPEPASRDEALTAGARDYAETLERYVRASPHLWTNWRDVWRPT